MRRGDIWLAQVGTKLHPVVVLTRDSVLDVRANVTVAEITTQERGLVVEVPVGPETGIDQPSVINCDGIHTVDQRRLVRHVGMVDDDSVSATCVAVAAAMGCDI